MKLYIFFILFFLKILINFKYSNYFELKEIDLLSNLFEILKIIKFHIQLMIYKLLKL